MVKYHGSITAADEHVGAGGRVTARFQRICLHYGSHIVVAVGCLTLAGCKMAVYEAD